MLPGFQVCLQDGLHNMERNELGLERLKPVPEDQRSTVGLDSGIEEALRAWRLAEARRRGVPAFRILSDQALRAMATRRPGTVRELLGIPGIGITTVEKYARQFYRILQKSGG
jgi:DNA topoisomerase-3